jgi:hypothetical protein
MKQNFYRKIIQGLSLTSVMFVFQACYGTPQDFGNDINLAGVVTSSATGKPVEGIKISIENSHQYQLTDSIGRFAMYVPKMESYNIKFEDIDSINNGSFRSKDTTLTTVNNSIYLNIALESR